MIKRDSEVLAQCAIDEEFLLNKSNQLGNFTKTEKIRKYLTRKAKRATASSIKDLRIGMHHINLKAKILEVTDTKYVVTRYGTHASIAKALIADETGTAKLCLWNGQIASVSVGDTVQIENAQVYSFRGEKYMTLGKKGTLINIENFKPQTA